jgi:hypothetical protein
VVLYILSYCGTQCYTQLYVWYIYAVSPTTFLFYWILYWCFGDNMLDAMLIPRLKYHSLSILDFMLDCSLDSLLKLQFHARCGARFHVWFLTDFILNSMLDFMLDSSLIYCLFPPYLPWSMSQSLPCLHHACWLACCHDCRLVWYCAANLLIASLDAMLNNLLDNMFDNMFNAILDFKLD